MACPRRGTTIADPVPDANTLWDFRETLIAAGAFDRLFGQLDQAIKDAGFMPMGGQIIDASLAAAPRRRNTQDEKETIKAGKTASEIWPDKPAKASQKDTDARWTLKRGRKKQRPDGSIMMEIASPIFGCESHINVDQRFGFARQVGLMAWPC